MNDIAEAYLRLSLIPNVGSATLRKLLRRYGSPLDALNATRTELMQLERVGAKIADAFIAGRDNVNVDAVKSKLSSFGASYISMDDERYPRLLRNVYDAPVGLFVKGFADLNAPSVAIVGCRNCSVYGKLVARKFGETLSRMGLTVVSGLARGIDSAAHLGALDAKAPTVAVLGCGLDIIYPPENIDLYRQIGETGAVITEYPFGTRADKQTFPLRNRIIAGMSSATLLVESDIRGGGMITARLACDFGRDVFAIPGRIDQSTSAGCHAMLRDGARLVTTPQELAEELGFTGQFLFDFQKEKSVGNPDAPKLSDDEVKLYETLSSGDALAADEISEISNLPINKILAAAMMLELKKLIAKRSDGRWEKRL